MIKSYNNHIKFLNDIYTNLNSKFSKAYLEGSDWYIGETLVNNSRFVYPPNEILNLYGFKQHNIEKSMIILHILYQYISNIVIDSKKFISNYDINLDFKLNYTNFEKLLVKELNELRKKRGITITTIPSSIQLIIKKINVLSKNC